MFKRFKKAAAAICAASMVLSMTACGSAGDKKVELHFTHTQSPGSISDLTAQEFKRLVEERSGGRIKVNIYSNCGLSGGDLTKAIELVQATLTSIPVPRQTSPITIKSFIPSGFRSCSPTRMTCWHSATVTRCTML